MMGKRFIERDRGSSLLLQLTALLLLLLLAGCAGGSYGKLDRNRDLDNMFTNYEILPDHNYYVTGGYTRPSAILAINKEYALVNEGNLWVGVPNVDSGQMRIWIENIKPDENYRYSGVYFAAYILNPDGNRVGALYSIQNQATIKFYEGKKIEVYPPQVNNDFNFNRGLMFNNAR